MAFITVDEALKAIASELFRAIDQHPKWPRDAVHAAAIVGEESGELTRAVLRWNYEGGDFDEMTKEAVQTGAMAVRFLMHAYEKKNSR